MRKLRRAAAIAAAVIGLMMMLPTAAYAAASLSLDGSVVIQDKRTLSVPLTATCDYVGQETTFIVVTVTQGFYQDAHYVEGQGDVLEVLCDTYPHTYNVSVPVTFGSGKWKTGEAVRTAIISNCYTENGSLNCTTQGFLPTTTIAIIRSR